MTAKQGNREIGKQRERLNPLKYASMLFCYYFVLLRMENIIKKGKREKGKKGKERRKKKKKSLIMSENKPLF